MVRKITVYWRDIPAQVIVQQGRKRERAMLSERFQSAIDRAAMRAGKGSSDAYIAEWRRDADTSDLPGDLRSIAAAEARRIEDEFSDERLADLIRRHGVDER